MKLFSLVKNKKAQRQKHEMTASVFHAISFNTVYLKYSMYYCIKMIVSLLYFQKYYNYR